MSEDNQYEIDITDKYSVRKEMWCVLNDIKLTLEERMAGTNTPTITVKKCELKRSFLGVNLDSETDVSISPKKFVGKYHWRNLQWEVEKKQVFRRAATELTEENLYASELLRHPELPRTYRGIGENESAKLFRNDRGESVGWMVYREADDYLVHLSFIGTVVEKEQGGVGTAMLSWLKSRSKAISLTALAYDTAGRGYKVASDRLMRFYVRNGFALSSNGFYWLKSEPNLEDGLVGEKMVVRDSVVANGVRLTDSDLMEVYLRKLITSGHLEEIFGRDGSRVVNAWMDIRKQLNMIDVEIEENEFQEFKQRLENLGNN